MFRFEKLEIWQRSADYAGLVYDATEQFPGKERFGLTSQLRRAAASISANIAEGSSRSSDRDFSRFIEIAYGSLCETVSFLRLAYARGFIPQQDLRKLYESAEELARMLTAFRSSLGKWKSIDDANE
jgi:four helix bundle protein